MEQIECDICGGENKPGAECDNFICPNYEPNRTMKDTPTPRTDQKHEVICESWSNSVSSFPEMTEFARQLERELTAMTEQRDEWKAKYIQQNKDLGCEMMDPNGTIWDYAKKMQLQVTAMTEQQDGLRWGIDYASDQLHKVTEQRDGLRKRIAQLEDELAKACVKVEELAEIGLDQMDKERTTSRKLSDYKNQRDRLAMALQELCEALMTGNPRDITELLNKAGDALQFTTNPNEL